MEGTYSRQAIFPFQAKFAGQNKRIQKGAGRNAAAGPEQTIPLRTGHEGNWSESQNVSGQ